MEKVIDFVFKVYALTIDSPSGEIYGLKSQMRRSAIFVSSNNEVVSARKNTSEFIKFL
jgi:four helix bundle protein